MNSTSISPQNHRAFVEPAISGIARTNTETDFNNSTDNNIIPSSFEKNLLESLSENKEFNFAKCFPFHRKLSTFPTQQLKLNLSSIVPLNCLIILSREPLVLRFIRILITTQVWKSPVLFSLAINDGKCMNILCRWEILETY